MSSRAARRSKLAELANARKAGKKVSYEVQEAVGIYDEVDEEGYKKIVRERMDQDDFVVDDQGEGYADDGREEWDRAPYYGSESDEELPARGNGRKASKSSRTLFLPIG